MSSEKQVLLNCPFCGKEPRYVPADYVDDHGQPWPFAECNPCNVGAPVEFWNKRAAQSQGEPVYQVAVIGAPEGWRDVGVETFTDLIGHNRYEYRILYAEQPAPVAVSHSCGLDKPSSCDACKSAPLSVALPEFDEWYLWNKDIMSLDQVKSGSKIWKACLDELKRLNPSL